MSREKAALEILWGGNEMSMKICRTCACRQDCRKSEGEGDFCLCWEAEPEEERVNVLRRLFELISFVPIQEEAQANG